MIGPMYTRLDKHKTSCKIDVSFLRSNASLCAILLYSDIIYQPV